MKPFALLCLSVMCLPAGEEALLGVGVGQYDNDPFVPSSWGDRERYPGQANAGVVEYRPSWDPLGRMGGDGLALRGLMGLECSDNGMAVAYAGGWLDVAVGPLFAGGSFGPALWHQGESKELGGALEFRSMLEVGWRASTGHRVAITCNHISNGGIYADNPGANTLAVIVLVPW